MSINGLRFNQERHSSAPLETKSGSYIYAGDAACTEEALEPTFFTSIM